MRDLDPELYAVVLAGGSGTRFWPLSRELYPKQMLALLGLHSLFQETLLRIQGSIPPERTLVVTNERHAFDLKLQADKLADGYRFLLEPEMKNTAPAIALAALHLVQEDPQAIMAVMPSDHLVQFPSQFILLLGAALEPARLGYLVTFGIKPVRPETGFGYIKVGKPLTDFSSSPIPILKAERFVEKPDLKTAESYLRSGLYYWNSGIFLWKASEILSEMDTLLPTTSQAFKEVKSSLGSPKEKAVLGRLYQSLDPISIDYGVMEKSSRVVLMAADLGWHDVGSWSALDEICPKDGSGNIRYGNSFDQGSRNSILFGGSRLLATIGLRDMVVVDTEDATLVCPKSQAQRVKNLAEELKRLGSKEHLIHRTVRRPWGQYTVLDTGDGYKIKRLEVNPGGRLSLQRHQQRSEHWVILSGIARVRIEEQLVDLHPHQSTFIPIGSKHRLENPGSLPLRIIETQNGDYLEEDDIERFDDDYGR